MRSFRSVLVLKRPQQLLWTVMRDHLPDFAGSIADIESVRQIERALDPDGAVCIVNQWCVRRQLPAALAALLRGGEFTWIDRNRWDQASGTCAWTIEPGGFGEHVTCTGVTNFATAMGGRGTRVTFAGVLEINPGLLGSLGSVAPMLSGLVESVVTTIIPRNLRAVVEAAAEFEPRNCG